jgi:hypothetical protein
VAQKQQVKKIKHSIIVFSHRAAHREKEGHSGLPSRKEITLDLRRPDSFDVARPRQIEVAPGDKVAHSHERQTTRSHQWTSLDDFEYRFGRHLSDEGGGKRLRRNVQGVTGLRARRGKRSE